MALRIWPQAIGKAPDQVYFLAPCRMDALACGAFAAIGVRDFRDALARWARRIPIVVLPAFAAVAAFCRGPVWSDEHRGASLVSIPYVSLLVIVVTAPARPLAPMLQRLTGGPVPVPLLLGLKYLFFPVVVLFAYGAARLSDRYLEEPFLRLKTRVPYPSPVVTAPPGACLEAIGT